MNKIILVLIKHQYIRNAEAYIGDKLPKSKAGEINDEIYIGSDHDKN